MLYDVYSGLLIALMVVMVLLAVGMIVVVMMQSGNQNNLGAITGAAESFFGKNKSRTFRHLGGIVFSR